ncbi:MAG: TonB-dependent receptor [Bacteroidia bacterium]|nr:TonB-dependent receptor [Bacteroidia bacterium]
MKKRFLTMLSLLFLGILVAGALSAQGIRVTGKVTDAGDGSALIGVTVQEKGTTNGTISDVSGNYSITVAPTATLVVSYVGYTAQEVAVSNRTSVNISLAVGELRLNEVLVIGYGTAKKADLTGSVKAVSSDNFNPGIVSSPQEMVIGKMAGVQITTGGGAPGEGATIRIRGGSSLKASNDPLIVIDGVAVDIDGPSGMRNPLSTINSNDIETFTVLKDASATAIYGSRASNGVILITTKRGKAGQPFTVNYTGSVSVSSPINYVDVFSAAEFRNIIATKYASDAAIQARLGSSETDWQKQIYRSAFSNDHNINFSGGLAKLPYRVSIGYTNQNGILKTDNLERLTGSININPSLFDDHLKLEINAKGMTIDNVFANRGAIGSAVSMDPTQAKDFVWMTTTGTPEFTAPMNPLVQLNDYHDLATVNRFLGNFTAEYKLHFFPALKAKLNLGLDKSHTNGTVNIPTGSYLSYSTYLGKGRKTIYNQNKTNSLLDFYFDYSGEFGGHSRLNVVAGYSWQHFYRDGKTLTATKYHESVFEDSDYKSENYLISFFGRLNYVLKDKYLLTFTLRDDGSSRFSPETRWGLFPSAALAWNVTKESFLANNKILSNLKLRLGYGITGQQNLGDNDYPYQANYKFADLGAYYQFGGNYVQTARPGGYDANLKWEETTTYNAGLDYGFLKDRINGEFDVYFRKTADLINEIPVPAGTNLTNYITTNVGDLENKGLEFSINAKVISKADLEWEIGFNTTYNVNKITKLTIVDDSTYQGVYTGGIGGGTGNTIQIHSVGYPAYSFFVLEQVYGANGKPIENLFVDRDGDGQITTSGDKYRYQKPAPTVFMGFSSMLTYKNLDFSFNGRINLGNYIYNNVNSGSGVYAYMGSTNYLQNKVRNLEYTQFENPRYFSDYYIENGSFLKLDNLALGYNFNNLGVDKLKMRIYASAQNLITITKYSGIDPEVFSGIDNNIYPRPRTFLLGISLTY